MYEHNLVRDAQNRAFLVVCMAFTAPIFVVSTTRACRFIIDLANATPQQLSDTVELCSPWQACQWGWLAIVLDL